MTQDQEKQAFLNALKENPSDETTHRVFADWLYEHGMDNEAQIHAEWNAVAYWKAMDWLTDFADECELTVEKLLAGADKYLAKGHILCLGTETPDRAWHDMDEFWDNYQYVRCLRFNSKGADGEPLDAQFKWGKTFIRCAC